MQHCDAALFDLDGVLTPTAMVHMAAWAKMFNEFLSEQGIHRPYTDEDYFTYVDGKPRYDGVRSFLESRDLSLPEGDPSDPPEAETICGLGNRKNKVFSAVLAADGVTPYPGSVALVDYLIAQGKAVAVVSSSANAKDVLAAAGLTDRFGLVVDGVLARREALPGKPAPDTYRFAAHSLGVPASRAVVFEDAVSGVAAGHAGDFGLVIGVDRGVGAEELITHGADLVVTDLADLLP